MSSSKKIIIFIFTSVVIYALWNGRNLLLGPVINVYSPSSEETIESNILSIRGNVKNASFISLNGRQIFVDKEGNFSEDVLVLSGYNILEISAKDRFGKTKTKSVSFYKKNI